ncbi:MULTISPECIES: prepilin-type N-terminal cleavage/methylation domain-containing protein [unclassified Cyanobium]|uniref:prepilin-type N-terminal cleavage/methylation domain-containing protein n=1 Tax=unclassified Cyanobium TaxID=2627006 RepID=UPI0020CBB0B3|nr:MULTISPECIES: prepilin-type N-terminal cleavage/methylation domain-containing protein [unclassified Cyanobium]MCP9835570.1 prepilin-type N-terminal cleavage/methylation domain-containing protein [Cyanobium sp. La Preciosa 7G6]MCP9938349.1 prepilin-type N-terminal cleavage/methylation domain-containing protein [Cyanobium sp. Aljojuca 7A6]
MKPLHRPHVAAAGFTLVELLVGVVLGGIALASIASVAVSHIRTTSRVTWNTQVQRDIAKINSFLAVESREACAFSAGAAAPANWATSPMPTPSPCTTACTTGAANEVRLLVPFNTGVNAAPTPRVIRFYTAVNGTTGLTELRRDGPAITATGQLNQTTNLTGSVLVDGVNTFTATVSPDCRTVTLQLSFDVPNNGGTTPLESITLTTGVRMFS